MKAYLYTLPSANLNTWDGTDPASVFEVIRGQPGGLGELPEPLGFQEHLELLVIRPGYIHPETGDRQLLAMPLGDRQPPEISYIPEDRTKPITVKPQLQWFIDADMQAYAARETAKAQDLQAKQAQEEAYAYAGARAKDYVQEFSKAPQPSQIDAIGHVLDAILEHLSGQSIDTAELSAILTKRAAIKARHPKG